MPTLPVIFSLRVLLVVLLACGGATGCGSSRRPAAPPSAVPSVTAPAQPAAAETLPDSLKWVQRSAEYEASVRQVYRLATAQVERAAAGRAAGSWGVVLDADETVISNLQYQIERSRLGAGFSPESWTAWVRRREAVPLPGAAAFLTRVRALGGRIAIVTNRLQSECDDTIALFRAHALAFDAMLCRPDGSPSDKNPRFAAVAAGQTPAGPAPIEVAAFVGDNILDFPALNQATRQQGEKAFAEFGVRYFMLPNPMYGGWQ
jgi:5'-nucleotidase (lipoprotein e(P4) family)